MKITKIEVCDFRGFPGPGSYAFEFARARNLFIYGENGSGKSSLFQAIREFFNRDRSPKKFEEFKNTLVPALTDGHITVWFDDVPQVWKIGGKRPLSQSPASQTALQVGCLDYRSLLETNFTQRGDTVNLFDIAIRHLVPHFEVPVDGQSRRIGDLWETVEDWNPAIIHHYPRYLKNCASAVNAFNTGFGPIVEPLTKKASELLSKFLGSEFELLGDYQPVNYNINLRVFDNRELILSVRRNGDTIKRHHQFLNEACLSAIGLAVYFAGLLISVPPESEYPKLLVLDDVLIGLDMVHRQPVLEILREYFSDWQIVLLTHDRVWYEMVQVELEDREAWEAYEIWLDDDGVTPVHRPRSSGYDYFLKRSEEHLKDNDARAAAVYARAAFEARVKKYCHRYHVPVQYDKNPRHMKADSFWKAARSRALTMATTDGYKANLKKRFAAVEVARKAVLNPLSHSAAQPVTKVEVESAIEAVQDLEFELKPNIPKPPKP